MVARSREDGVCCPVVFLSLAKASALSSPPSTRRLAMSSTSSLPVKADLSALRFCHFRGRLSLFLVALPELQILASGLFTSLSAVSEGPFLMAFKLLLICQALEQQRSRERFMRPEIGRA